jgi:lipopolysaccharide biosynthesis regulator YciM
MGCVQAEQAYTKAVHADDKQAPAWQGLAELYTHTLQWAKAAEAYQALVRGHWTPRDEQQRTHVTHPIHPQQQQQQQQQQQSYSQNSTPGTLACIPATCRRLTRPRCPTTCPAASSPSWWRVMT